MKFFYNAEIPFILSKVNNKNNKGMDGQGNFFEFYTKHKIEKKKVSRPHFAIKFTNFFEKCDHICYLISLSFSQLLLAYE